MPDICVTLNGRPLRVLRGTTVAAMILQAGEPCRASVTGEPRAALCGMGICFECRANVDGVAHQPTCQTLCADGMTVETLQ
jgi:sarcosine oxidase subunit alpha